MDIFNYIYRQSLWSIIAVMVICIIVWSIAGYICTQRYKRFWKRTNAVIFLVCTGAVLYTTVFRRSQGTTDVVLIPFYSFVEAQQQPEMYRSVLMNAFLFMPLGLTLPFLLPTTMSGGKNIAFSILALMLLSLCIEILQFIFHLGRAEVDDVIFNTLGAAVGTIAYRNATRRRRL